jgi:hypothetical protein
MTKQKGYFSYLLRVWQTSNGEESVWSASLEQPGTQERRGFATLDELVRFLQDQAISQSQGAPLGEGVETCPGQDDPSASEL